ncbi:alpha/beta hydrolase [Amycolatopsis cynarae]|uniref:Alpha/beta hydrolase n=1 Tax=Amycolatopsis cynarae TaxID=2995223 RepID=A0ABY7AXK0_9PSEU|nr:alpha/beta hydrolase [Amycolatopsis sp. HUAS 11-8]WAL63637.1 alpha/beta hydrolase [Amycolatopsis sp. HUAS 11-8]
MTYSVLLDPELAAAAVDLPPGNLADPAAARALNRERHAARPAYPGRDRLEVTERRLDGDVPVPVRLYRPRGRDGIPAVVWLHGGAFILGDLDATDALCARISDEAGALVVNVDYRLAPEHPCPAGLDDSVAALDWVAAHAGDLGVDPARIAIAGASAGGCLAAGVALKARDRGGPPLAFQLLVYPVLDDRCATASARETVPAPVFDARSNVVMWRTYLAGRTPDAYAAPARAEDLSGLPPAMIVVAELDPLRDEAIEYANRLSAAGVEVILEDVPGTFHGFDAVVPDAAVSRRVTDFYVRTLAERLAG